MKWFLTFKVGKCIKKVSLIIEIQFDYKSKYIAQIIYNKKFPLPTQKVITKMMNHNNQILSSKTLWLYKLIFSLLKWSFSNKKIHFALFT